MTASLDPAALRDRRLEAGPTQGQVARALGLAGGEAVSVWERGAFEPNSAALLHRLADVLAVAVPELLRCEEGEFDLRYLRLVAGLAKAFTVTTDVVSGAFIHTKKLGVRSQSGPAVPKG